MVRACPLDKKPATSMTGTLGVEGSSCGLFTPSRRAAAGPAGTAKPRQPDPQAAKTLAYQRRQ